MIMADTGFWLALANKKDKHHLRAKECLILSRSQTPFGNDCSLAPRCQSKMIDNHCVW